MNNQASEYSYFKIDGSEFRNDIHFALSKSDGHSDKKWEIVIGGWAGTKSVIRRDATTAHSTPSLSKPHSTADFNKIKGDITVYVSDGELIIKGGDEIFMQYQHSSIKKNELKYLLVSGGYGGYGTYKITGFKKEGEFIYKSNKLTLLKETTVKLQSGQFWNLTCKTKLIGTVTDIAAIVDKIENTTDNGEATIDFYLDIMCCDPNETNCKQDCKSTDQDAIPILKIGPNSDADARFFIKTGMNTYNRDMGFFHIEKLHYQGFDHNGDLIENFDMIEKGCNVVGPLLEFNGEST